MEKLNVTVPNKAWLEGPYKELPCLVDGSSLIFSMSFEIDESILETIILKALTLIYCQTFK